MDLLLGDVRDPADYKPALYRDGCGDKKGQSIMLIATPGGSKVAPRSPQELVKDAVSKVT